MFGNEEGRRNTTGLLVFMTVTTLAIIVSHWGREVTIIGVKIEGEVRGTDRRGKKNFQREQKNTQGGQR